MPDQEEFFSQKHKRLLKIATWAKYLAWIALGIFIINTILVIFQKQASHQQMMMVTSTTQSGLGYWDMVRLNPLYYLVDIGTDMVATLIRGIIYYVVLKAISLGLTMIVETDINYRENENLGGAG